MIVKHVIYQGSESGSLYIDKSEICLFDILA